MKHLIRLVLFLFAIHMTAQKDIGILEKKPDAPGNFFNSVTDQYGNSYTAKDINIGTEKRDKKGMAYRSSLLCSSGIFNLYFDPDSGMADNSDPIQVARRNVACQVFQDISNFLVTPLNTSGQKVNIWVRNIGTIGNVPSAALGLASSFYAMPYKDTAGFGGIADNEIWKTIQTGQNSYTGIFPPLASSGVESGTSGLYYHGFVALNFNSTAPGSPSWNTNLGAACPSNQFDLYTILLHEVTHALGFASLVNQDGNSRLGTGFNYFTRYDRFLNSGTLPLLTTVNPCVMYNYIFNTALSQTVLHPSATCITDQTTCATALKYLDASMTIPVYTPNCYEPGSSLSHFEDMCYQSYTNNSYFAMCNGGGTGITRRFLKTEERRVLVDLGYGVATTYGSSATFQGTINYGGTASTSSPVAGVNDGIVTSGPTIGTFSITGYVNTAIAIPNVLSNDYAAAGATILFEGLTDVFDSSATISSASGNSSTAITINTTVPGTHLLRYVPYDSVTQRRGNLTYVYVYVFGSNGCAAYPSACDLVVNGNFEQKSSTPSTGSGVSNGIVCGWRAGNMQSPDYFHADSIIVGTDVPCNTLGYEPDNITNNKGYVGMNINSGGSEPLLTTLTTPLLPNTTYKLTFDVSLVENAIQSTKLQAYLSVTEIAGSYYNTIPIANPSMLYTNTGFSTTKNGWETISFLVTTSATGGEKYLYIGGLSNNTFQAVSASANQAGCGTTNLECYYYVDNVHLVPINKAVLNLPVQACTGTTLPNLANFLEAAPNNGVFSGPGVSLSGGVYQFNASTAGIGQQTITYTFTNNLGCAVSISDTISVVSCGGQQGCPDNLTFMSPEAATLQTYQAASIITAGTNYTVGGTASITMVAGSYIQFTPNTNILSGTTFIAKIDQCPQPRNTPKAEEDYAGVLIYPNPSSGIFSIDSETPISAIKVISIDGKLMYTKQIKKQDHFDLDFSNHAPGIYIVIIEAGGISTSKKIVLK